MKRFAFVPVLLTLALAAPLSAYGIDLVDVASIRRHDRSTARALAAALTRPGRSAVDRTLDAAELSVESRRPIIHETLGGAATRALDQELSNLATARRLLATGALDGLDVAVAASRLAAEWQSVTLNASAGPTRSAPAVELPSTALRGLIVASGGSVPPAMIPRLSRWDGLPDDVRIALARVLGAFTSYAVQSKELFTPASIGSRDLAAIAASGGFLAARQHLVEAAAALEDAVRTNEIAAIEPIRMPPYVAITFASENDTYTDSYRLQIDAGGDDTYLNNAGGSNLHPGCSAVSGVAAALVDLGGNDSYVAHRPCGSNGGGFQGAGFLFDAAGDDVYEAGGRGVNGGGRLGAGFLLDVRGNDRYTSFNDLFTPHGEGAMGGASVGTGVLVDGAGNDSYGSGLENMGVNGGSVGGAGFLFDAGGSDRYRTFGSGTNGGAVGALDVSSGSAGFLLDAGTKADQYLDDWFLGTNGGGAWGVGFLLDEGGSDTYRSEHGWAGNGAGHSVTGPAAGLLVDVSGHDTYLGGGTASNVNGAGRGAPGFLIDGSGRDRYDAGGGEANGGSSGATGMLVDGAGGDSYRAGSQVFDRAVNGGGYGGHGFLLDVGQGDDSYVAAGNKGMNGAGHIRSSCVIVCAPLTPGTGFLLDQGGTDVYQDPLIPGGSRIDCTIVPKGLTGAQVDLPHARC